MRVQLLKENKDCVHCCGDHASANCTRNKHICGGGQSDHGCNEKHVGHELFCVSAKVFAVQHVHSQQGSSAEGVVLLISMLVVSKSSREHQYFGILEAHRILSVKGMRKRETSLVNRKGCVSRRWRVL